MTTLELTDLEYEIADQAMRACKYRIVLCGMEVRLIEIRKTRNAHGVKYWADLTRVLE